MLFFQQCFFPLLMILRQAKNAQSGRACAPGGAPFQGAGDPRLRTGCVVFACHRTRGPLWAEWTIPRMCARDGWGCGGGMMLRPRPWLASDLLRTRK